MYGTTVVYPLSMAGNYKWLILNNPMTSVIETLNMEFLVREYRLVLSYLQLSSC